MPRFQGGAGQPLASTLKQLISQFSATLEQKVITINERGLTSTQWTVYNGGTKRTTYSAVPTSDTTAEAVAVDGFSISQKDNVGITITAARHYSAEGMTLTQTDGRGNATATETDKAGRTARKGTTVNDTFAYSNRSELTEATVSGASYRYAYDNIGNRKSAQEAAEEATAYTANALNQYTAIDDFTPTYDADGNQTLVKTSTGIWTVAYNAENRPITFTNNESNTVVECTYDYMGRRATKKVETNGETTLHQRYIYRDYLQIACCDLTRANHPCLWLITWDPTQPVVTRPLAIQKSGTWYCYGWDLTKNICEVFGSNGYINTIYTYTPYGEVSSNGDVTQPIQWSSEYHDSELALVYYNYRHYNCADGKWLSRDMLGEFVSLNVYAYVENEPIENSDFFGLVIDTIWDVGNMLWDVGKIATGAITGNSAMVAEGATDLALDAAAAIIPGVPAGASKVARASAKAARKEAQRKTKQEAIKRAKRRIECEAIHAAYDKLKCRSCGKKSKSAKLCPNDKLTKKSAGECADIGKNIACWSAKTAGRKAYIDKKCDYYLDGSISIGSKTKEKGHKGEYATCMGNLAVCTAMFTKYC